MSADAKKESQNRFLWKTVFKHPILSSFSIPVASVNIMDKFHNYLHPMPDRKKAELLVGQASVPHSVVGYSE